MFVTHAGGGVVVDVDGNSLIDFGAGIAVVSVGNAAPRVVERVQAQVERFTHTCFMVTPYESYVAVCEELNRLTPGDHEKRSFLLNSGAEAVENAVKVATFGGHPVACAAALGAIRTLEEEDLVERARRIGVVMLPRLRAIAERAGVIGDVRGRGAMTAVELVRGRGDKTPNPEATAEVVRRCHADGLLVLTCGTYGNVIRFLPPLVIPDHLLTDGLSVLEKAFTSL